jgi:hypothetical protein
MKKVWLTIKLHDDIEEIRMFDDYDHIAGLYDYTEQVILSKITYDKIKSGDYFLKKYGISYRAYC